MTGRSRKGRLPLPHNIERAKFFSGYVGYGAGKVWRIQGQPDGAAHTWRAVANDTFETVYANTLNEMSMRIENHTSAHR